MSIKLTGESMQQDNSNRRFEFDFFKLKNNHDKAIVRFLHNDYNDFERRPVHYVRLPNREYRKGVNCLRADEDAFEKCPFCNTNIDSNIVTKRRKKIYIEFLVYAILDKNNNVINDFGSSPRRMVWEQNKKFDDKIFSLTARYNPLYNTVFQVERFGEAGSTDTSYDIYAIDVDTTKYPFTMPENVYNPDGSYLLDKTFDEMNYYLENGDFPPKDNGDYRARADVRPQVNAGSQNYAPVNVAPEPVPDSSYYSQQPIQQPTQQVQYGQQPVNQPTQQYSNSQQNVTPSMTRRRSI